MKTELSDILNLSDGTPVLVEKVHLPDKGIHVEGEFELPPLARLAMEDQIFVAAFVRCHGSIKEMEKYFGVSYPTIKGKLRRLAEILDFVNVEISSGGSDHRQDILDRLEKGEISADQALKELK
ncbi:MAG: DUF2089 domain-containing protein [Bdellovibrionaceae bacterium]|nr:DUF2089 domain-containing protein [Bdellovibrionales bacterium]MCB9083433.1 DUF2089 domain-containing protein [Pseudobdellovibrionaceae bacterium]